MTALWPVYNGPDDVSEVESVALAKRDLPVSTYDIVSRAAAQWADEPALVVLPSGELWESPQQCTFGELGAMVHRYANTFTACGVGRRDAVAVLSPNVGDLPVVLLAAEAAGIASPLNPALEPAVLCQRRRHWTVSICAPRLRSSPATGCSRRLPLLTIWRPTSTQEHYRCAQTRRAHALQPGRDGMDACRVRASGHR